MLITVITTVQIFYHKVLLSRFSLGSKRKQVRSADEAKCPAESFYLSHLVVAAARSSWLAVNRETNLEDLWQLCRDLQCTSAALRGNCIKYHNLTLRIFYSMWLDIYFFYIGIDKRTFLILLRCLRKGAILKIESKGAFSVHYRAINTQWDQKYGQRLLSRRSVKKHLKNIRKRNVSRRIAWDIL